MSILESDLKIACQSTADGAVAATSSQSGASAPIGPSPALLRVLGAMQGIVTSRVLGELSQLGVIAAMGEHGVPVDAKTLASKLNLHAEALQRALRLCAAGMQ